MGKLINIEIENTGNGHQDLMFEIPKLLSKKEFDTYYFSLAIAPKSGFIEVKNAVAELITFWKQKISEMNNFETIFLPIDLSDQSTGCLKVKMDNNLLLTYGYSKKEGWSINPLKPSLYYKSVNDFIAEPKTTITYSKVDFIQSLDEVIETLIK